MIYSVWYRLIVDIGFPITVSLILLYYFYNILIKINQTLKTLTQLISLQSKQLEETRNLLNLLLVKEDGRSKQ